MGLFGLPMDNLGYKMNDALELGRGRELNESVRCQFSRARHKRSATTQSYEDEV